MICNDCWLLNDIKSFRVLVLFFCLCMLISAKKCPWNCLSIIRIFSMKLFVHHSNLFFITAHISFWLKTKPDFLIWSRTTNVSRHKTHHDTLPASDWSTVENGAIWLEDCSGIATIDKKCKEMHCIKWFSFYHLRCTL